jgi:PAS domain-containing protein
MIQISDAVLIFRSLLLRISPISFVSHPQMRALVCGSRDLDDRVRSGAHAIFQTSQDALISLNAEGIIESLNPSGTAIFGFTPDKCLDNHLNLLSIQR